jgi:HD-like signal output (HDOD) protein/ActR/RegA family two-component response regulator
MKRILFVDDEPAALEGLRLRLHRMSTKWETGWAESGLLAIEQMERQPYDVVVTDLRMPGMDGAKLLEIVSARWPQTIRIVLSGYADPQQTQTMRVVPLAHQYLSKPCEPQQLEGVIDRCLLLHDLLHGPRLRAIVGRIRKLPAIPRIYSALQGIVKDDKVTVSEVARLVSTDPAIAARVLQIVNSAFFRLARRITNIEQAVSYLGFTAIRNIAMSVEIFSQWPSDASSHLNQAKLQAHVGAVAAAASALTMKTPIADDTMLAGLLHDIGYWVLAQECSAEVRESVELAAATGIRMHEAESQVIGASHAEIGAYLLGIWGLPYSVIEAVAHHHEPQRVSQAYFDALAALAIAQALVCADDASAFDLAVPPDSRVDESYLISVTAPFDWSEAQRRVAETTESEEGSP